MRTTLTIDNDVLERARAIAAKLSIPLKTVVNDAILAATVLLTGGKIYTLNFKHYPMPELPVQPAWKA